ncbi:hypothetical protein [Streptomyces wuyuanensis]|uniref:Peptidase family M41 n=1 Tax=Streptomyces wuyuanensis TaxID=1196353 RepID=A0A1H0EGL8_9ACTN|nr:hypothetical protein [Streptomyces wuyuanensis]SDN81409.1 hypothetical protein SAMN05444921_1449 [Streptomyces wuyuanensis]
MSLRSTAEHEAAHAVVARHYRVPVHEVWVDPRTLAGRTECAKTSLQQTAVILAAGDLWCRELSALPYEDRACSDLRRFERDHGFQQLWHVEREARRILTQHREAVLGFAARLVREQHIVLTRSRAA